MRKEWEKTQLEIRFTLECGNNVREQKEYFWVSGDEKQNQLEIARYENFLAFNKVGNYLHCEEHNALERIRMINIRVISFDARKELV